ncbi:MAG TPA: hypothetical protein ENN76_03240, partial [Euryarchaeota archaeon]|nr:hypothetical protein [Euryarchaeota archaeon]
MTGICVKCGSEKVEVPPLCKKCHLENFNVNVKFPKNLKVKICPECGRQSPTGGRIDDMDDVARALESLLQSKTQIQGVYDSSFVEIERVELADGRAGKATVRADVTRDGMTVSHQSHVTVYVGESACEECSLKRGGYFEATIQVRGTDRQMTEDEISIAEALVTDLLNDMRDRGVNHSFLTKTARHHGGVDFMVGGGGAGKNVVEELCRTFSTGVASTTSTLFGEKDGRRVFRMTYLIRLAKARVGDLVEHEKELFQIIKGKNHYDLANLRTGERVRMPREELEKGDVIASQDSLLPAVIVDRQDGAVEVIDPHSSNSVVIKAIDDIPDDA